MIVPLKRAQISLSLYSLDNKCQSIIIDQSTTKTLNVVNPYNVQGFNSESTVNEGGKEGSMRKEALGKSSLTCCSDFNNIEAVDTIRGNQKR